MQFLRFGRKFSYYILPLILLVVSLIFLLFLLISILQLLETTLKDLVIIFQIYSRKDLSQAWTVKK